jgi:UPF0755 protein
MEKKITIKLIVIIAVLVVFGAGLFSYFSKDKEMRPESKGKSEVNAEIPVETAETKDISNATSLVSEDQKEPMAEKDQEPLPKKETVKEEPDYLETLERFVVPLPDEKIEQTAKNLFDQGFIKDEAGFLTIFSGQKIAEVAPGGYKISKEMDASQIAKILSAKPYMEWVVVPEGLRKEETADTLTYALGWDAVKKAQWISAYAQDLPEYTEGVYFPETYLIPVDENPVLVAKRFIDKFNEKFEPYLTQFNAQNIKWTTGLTLASIVQREAANAADMPLIARILWNRLEQEMPLNVDATLQYVRGDEGNGWWAPIAVADKKIKSPYNTYLNKGLPPYPICNPGLAAIKAVLSPVESGCLYYLHDSGHITHCAITYEEHLANIETYLKEQ